MDPFYTAVSLYRKRNLIQCAQVCTDILQENGQHQAAWILKVRALTQRVAYDDTEVLESLAEATSAENRWTKTAPNGTSTVTSVKTAKRDKSTTSDNRPPTQSRPLSGVVRLNHGGLGGSHDISNSQGTAKSRAQTSRILSRLGTASLSTETESFINVARINLAQYAALSQLVKPLFEYLYFVQGDVKSALELANQAQQSLSILQSCSKDEKNHFWKCAIARCLVRLGLVRQIVQTTSDWHIEMNNTDGVLLIAKSYLIIDQPMAALEIYKKGLEKFPKDTVILSGIARIYEDLQKSEDSVSTYKEILNYDCSNTEAVACIAAYLFYTGQPEWALVLYRRLLQMGIHTAEVFCNIALCCLKTQQFDMVIPCIENALSLAAKDDLLAMIWYNAGHVGLATGDLQLAELCWKLTRRINAYHCEACNNLAVLALLDGRKQEGKALLLASLSLCDDIAEAKFNLEKLTNQDNEPVECLI
ncbi:Tetratricopeptide repeat protein 8 [Daphnia magna]|uniref:Tetratricopeptide repeat protein 8 n=1 Tax=Daphnia magna TaxID=35525 RepID=A0A164VV27_9CRUS|nr:Tetratricopeptide repeat protein 8 [Daphnia magna]